MCLFGKRHHKPRPPKPPVPPPTPQPVSITVAWVNTDRNVSNNDVAAWIAGLNAQVSDVQALWPHVRECQHVLATSSDPPTVIRATIKPTLPEAPGALAYHDVDSNGHPFIVVGSQTCRQAGVSISSAMSHEAVELTVDPSCTLTATAPNGDVWALEVGDPVQASSYSVTTAAGATVEVSDLVGQAFFGMGASALDKTGDCAGRFMVAPGGYAIVNGQSTGQDRFGDPDDLPHRVPPAKFVNEGAPVVNLGKYQKTVTALVTGLIGWALLVVSAVPKGAPITVTAQQWVALAVVVAVALGVYAVPNA